MGTNKTNFKNKNITPEIFASMIAVVAGIMTYIARLGLDNHGLLIIKSVLISFFIIFFPHVLLTRFSNRNTNVWYLSKAFLLLICLSILVVVGSIRNTFYIDLSLLFIFAGLTCFLITIIIENKNGKLSIGVALYLLFVVIAVWSTTAYSLNNLFHPLMKEKIITGAWPHRDVVWHASVAGIFKTYGVSSLGLDGLVPLFYNSFTHFVYGAISGLLGVSTITFFNILAPTIICPIFFLAFLFCVREVGVYFALKHNFLSPDENQIRYWALFSILFFIPFPYQLDSYLGGDKYNFLTGTYSFALFLTFILISVVFSVFNKVQSENGKIALNIKMFFVPFLMIFYLAIGVSKVSFIYLIGVSYGYLFVRLRLYKSLIHTITIVGLLFAAVFLYATLISRFAGGVSSINYSSGVGLISYYRNHLFSYIVFVYPSLFYIFYKIYFLKIRSISGFFQNKKNSDLIDIELLLFLMVACFIPPSSFFSGYQIFIAYVLILSHINLFICSESKKKVFTENT